jgi:hypothetical protein
MILEITLQPEKTKLEITADTLVQMRMRNTGPDTIVVSDPQTRHDFPILKAKNQTTGKIHTFRWPPLRGGGIAVHVPIESGKSLNWTFWLRDLVRFPEPGSYEVTAEMEWDGGLGTGVSAPVVFEVEGVSPKTLQLGAALLPESPDFYAYWTELKDKARRLLRTSIQSYNDTKVLASAPIAGTAPEADFFVSTGTAKSDPSAAWIVWLSDRTLHHAFVDRKGDSRGATTTPLPDLNAQIIPSPIRRDTGEGEIVLWLGARNLDNAKVQIALVAPNGKSTPGPDLMLPITTAPVWGQTAFLSNGQRRLYLALFLHGSIKLFSTGWDMKGVWAPLESHAETAGRFVAGGLTMMNDDSVVGMLVFRQPDSDRQIQIIKWSHTASGTFAAEPPETVDFNDAANLENYLIRFDRMRQPVVLLKPTEQPWHARHGASAFKPLGGNAYAAPAQLGVFFNPVLHPIVVFPFGDKGLTVTNLDGTPPEQAKF